MILISLLGSSVPAMIPVIFEFKDLITKHIFIFDDGKHEANDVIQYQTALKRMKTEYHLSFEIVDISIDEIDKNSLQTTSNFITNLLQNNNEDIYLLTNEAPGHLTILFSSLVMKSGGCILSYDKYDNNFTMLTNSTISTKKIENSLDIPTFMFLLQYEIEEALSKKDLITDKEDVMYLFKEYTKFFNLRNALIQGNEVEYLKYPHLLERLKTLSIIDKNYSILNKVRLSGGLFEEYIFWLVEPLGFDDIMLGVKMIFLEKHDINVENEFDILMMKDNHIYTIECKQKRILEGLSFIYKYDALISYFGEDAKAIIVNPSPVDKELYLDRKSSKNFNASNILRALSNNIDIYHEDTIEPIKLQSQVKQFFSL
mgnify:CR=1 FL=1